MKRLAAMLGFLVIGSPIAIRPILTRAAEPATAQPAFTVADSGFRFDTGLLTGSLRADGRSLGLTGVVDAASGTELAGRFGLLSHYRLLDRDARYGHAAWDWASEAQLLGDGAVEVRWTADEGHPFDMKAVYRFKGPGTLDVETNVTPRTPLKRFEVFLASYFAGFPETLAYVAPCPETGGKAAFLEATEASGHWQTFPRDGEAAAIFGDGRWQRPPNPVEWTIRPKLAGPLAMRRDPQRGLVALVMAPPSDCFGVSMPNSGEGHRSLYLSLFGRDLPAGETATARSRLVIGRGISEQQAVALYGTHLAEQAAAELPRVLPIGDSIINGYHAVPANTRRPPPCEPTRF